MGAADFLATMIADCTGVRLAVVEDFTDTLTWNKTSKLILLSSERLEKTAGIVWATDVDESIDLAYSGYMIKSVGDSVFIRVNSDYGYQTAVLAFLREVLGYEWFSSDTYCFGNKGETLPDLDITEKPDFDFNYYSEYIVGTDKYASGQTYYDPFVYTDGAFVHNSFIYLPPATYFSSHPKWYSDNKTNGIPDQLCYTAHGNKSEYDAMLLLATDRVINYLAANENACTVTFTQQDNYSACDCTTCKAAAKAFNSVSSVYIMFVNDLEDAVRTKLEEKAVAEGSKAKKITILFFAYYATENAPVSVIDEKYSLIANNDNTCYTDSILPVKVTLPYNKTYPDGIVCNENVGCIFAPITADYSHSFYDEVNENYRVSVEKWSLVTDKIYAWIYDTNFYYFLFPFNSYDSLFETVRCLKNNNADFLFVQSQIANIEEKYNKTTTCFGKFKTYAAYAVRFDVNLSYRKAADSFFEGYYRDASAIMRSYYEDIKTYLYDMEKQYPDAINGKYGDGNISDKKYWSNDKMNEWLSTCDDAFKAVEKYKTTDAVLYEKLYKHILAETIFPRFILCQLYADNYSEETIGKMRSDFYNDCRYLQIDLYSENVTLSSWIQSNWNLT